MATPKLPDKVQRIPGNEMVDTESLVVGDKFAYANTVWTVTAVTKDGLQGQPDPTYFFIGR